MSSADPCGGYGALLPQCRPARLPESPEGGSYSDLTSRAVTPTPTPTRWWLHPPVQLLKDFTSLLGTNSFLRKYPNERVFKARCPSSAPPSLRKWHRNLEGGERGWSGGGGGHWVMRTTKSRRAATAHFSGTPLVYFFVLLFSVNWFYISTIAT